MSEPNGQTGGSLRVLAVVNPSTFIGPEQARGFDELRSVGWLPMDAPGVLAYVDPMDDAAGPGEDPRGIEVRRHPEAILRDDPDLWDVVDRFRAGCPLEVSRAEYDSLTAWEIDARLIMLAATKREEARQMKRGNNGND